MQISYPTQIQIVGTCTCIRASEKHSWKTHAFVAVFHIFQNILQSHSANFNEDWYAATTHLKLLPPLLCLLLTFNCYLLCYVYYSPWTVTFAMSTTHLSLPQTVDTDPVDGRRSTASWCLMSLCTCWNTETEIMPYIPEHSYPIS